MSNLTNTSSAMLRCNNCDSQIVTTENKGLYRDDLCEYCERDLVESGVLHPTLDDVRRYQSIVEPDYPIYVICTEDVQEAAMALLDRELKEEEIQVVQNKMQFDWLDQIQVTIDVFIRDTGNGES